MQVLPSDTSVNPSRLYTAEPNIAFNLPAKEEKVDNAGDNKRWHTATYRERLAHVLSKKSKQEADQDILEAKKRHESYSLNAFKAYIAQIQEVAKKDDIRKEDLERLEKAKAALLAIPRDVTPEQEADLRSRGHSLVRRMWRGGEAVGLAPSLIADLADVIGFGSQNKHAVGAAGALAGAVRGVDTILNTPLAEIAVSENQSQAYLPQEDRSIQVSTELRQEADRRARPGAAAQLLTGLNRFLVQPATALVDTVSTVKDRGIIAAYNQYLDAYKSDPRIAKQRARFKRNQYLAGGMIGVEALLHALKYAAYLKQGGDPARYYAHAADAKWVNWANGASALAAALAMARRAWWSWQKSDHIDHAQKLHAFKRERKVKRATNLA